MNGVYFDRAGRSYFIRHPLTKKPEPSDTAQVKYVFVDVVGFTKNRSVEAQSYVVGQLNEVIADVLKGIGIDQEKTILIPTGDGVAIALLDAGPYDLHMQIALQILRQLKDHSGHIEDSTRRFNLRIGVNQNEDNLILDINGNRNVAGRGISLAQRIMDKADAGQILVGRAVYDTLIQREHYMQKFREFHTKDKHGEEIAVYQFCSDDYPGLNVVVPSAFAKKQIAKPKLSTFAAYYLAHASAQQQFLLSRKEPGRDYAAVVLLYFLAHDSVERSETPPHEEASLATWNAGKSSFEEQYFHYLKVDWSCLTTLHHFIEAQLEPYQDLFAGDEFIPNCAFIRPQAIIRVREDWPKIAQEFNLQEA